MCKKGFINFCLCLSRAEFPSVVCRAHRRGGLICSGVLWVVSGDPGSLCAPSMDFCLLRGHKRCEKLNKPTCLPSLLKRCQSWDKPMCLLPSSTISKTPSPKIALDVAASQCSQKRGFFSDVSIGAATMSWKHRTPEWFGLGGTLKTSQGAPSPVQAGPGRGWVGVWWHSHLSPEDDDLSQHSLCIVPAKDYPSHPPLSYFPYLPSAPLWIDGRDNTSRMALNRKYKIMANDAFRNIHLKI